MMAGAVTIGQRNYGRNVILEQIKMVKRTLGIPTVMVAYGGINLQQVSLLVASVIPMEDLDTLNRIEP